MEEEHGGAGNAMEEGFDELDVQENVVHPPQMQVDGDGHPEELEDPDDVNPGVVLVDLAQDESSESSDESQANSIFDSDSDTSDSFDDGFFGLGNMAAMMQMQALDESDDDGEEEFDEDDDLEGFFEIGEDHDFPDPLVFGIPLTPEAKRRQQDINTTPSTIQVHKFVKLRGTVTSRLSSLITVDKKQNNDPPYPRSGHRCVSDGIYLYCYGGYNPRFLPLKIFKEIWRLNLTTCEWKRLTPVSAMPEELASANVVLDGNNLVVFGGTGVPFGQVITNETSACNLSNIHSRILFKTLTTTGPEPQSGYGQAVTFDESKQLMYVFGGTSGHIYNNDLHVLDLRSLNWTRLYDCSKPQTIPAHRYRHEMILHKDILYVFAGGTSETVYGLDQIPAFNITTGKWFMQDCTLTTKVTKLPNGELLRCNAFPLGRRCHSLVKYKNSAYICGGYDGQNIFDDVWRLDLESMEWEEMPGKLNEPVYFHDASATATGCMLIFGGVTKLDVFRTASVYEYWLDVPPLSEFAFRSVYYHLSKPTSKLPLPKLVQDLGIPREFAERLEAKV